MSCFDSLSGADRELHHATRPRAAATKKTMKRIEETVLISAPRETAWQAFVDLTCWADWNRVLTGVRAAPEACLVDGSRFSCCLRR